MANINSVLDSIPLPNQKPINNSNLGFNFFSKELMGLSRSLSNSFNFPLDIDDLLIIGLIILIATEGETDYYLILVLAVLFFVGR